MLASGSQRTPRREGYPFLFERRGGILAHKGFITQLDSMHVDVPILTRCFPDPYSLLHSLA